MTFTGLVSLSPSLSPSLPHSLSLSLSLSLSRSRARGRVFTPECDLRKQAQLASCERHHIRRFAGRTFLQEGGKE